MARVIQFGNMTGYIPPNGVQVSGDGTATYRVQLDRGQGEAFLAAATADPYKEYDGFGGYIQPSKCSVESGHFDTVTLVFAARDPAMPHLEPGERVAQFVITPVLQPQYEEVEELTDTDRGVGGFGSTGK